MIHRTVKTVHSSGRFDVQLAAIYERYRKGRHLVTHTETQLENDILGDHGWGVIRGANVGPSSDPAIEYSREVLECIEKFILPISDLEYRRAGGTKSGKLFAAVGLFHVDGWEQILLQAAVHWPRWSQPERRDTYIDGIKNLGHFINTEYKESVQKDKTHMAVRVTGDWNQDLRDPMVQKSIEKLFNKTTGTKGRVLNAFNSNDSKWDWNGYKPDAAGTFGRQLYDGSLCSSEVGIIDTYLLPDNRESDHRPYGSEITEFTHRF